MIQLYHFYRAIFYSLYFPECFHFISIICLNILMIFLIIYSDLKQWFENKKEIYFHWATNIQKKTSILGYKLFLIALPINLCLSCIDSAFQMLLLSQWQGKNSLFGMMCSYEVGTINFTLTLLMTTILLQEDLEATAQHVNGLVYDILCANTVLLLAWFLQWSGQPNHRRWASSSHNYPIVC